MECHAHYKCAELQTCIIIVRRRLLSHVTIFMMNEDNQCALNPDGTLKEANEIIWAFDPDDDDTAHLSWGDSSDLARVVNRNLVQLGKTKGHKRRRTQV